jgi:hypothetical protein
MAKVKTTTTVEFPVGDFNRLLAEKLFPGKKIDVKFLIEEVGGDPMDRFPGCNEVTGVRITFDENPNGNMFWPTGDNAD